MALVQVIALPMIVFNSLGAALFVKALDLQTRLKQAQDRDLARQILSIANQTVAHLRAGLTEASARATVAIIMQETQVAAVAVTSGQTILAHVGAAEDHHMAWRRGAHPGHPQASSRPACPCSCAIARAWPAPNPAAPLSEAIIMPLRKGPVILGCLKLYGTRHLPLDETLFELAKGLADLFSTQLELEDIGIKNQLLAHAEIRRLQAQINPHFLFNSLNTIASFCRTAPSQARELLLDLSSYMRAEPGFEPGAHPPLRGDRADQGLPGHRTGPLRRTASRPRSTSARAPRSAWPRRSSSSPWWRTPCATASCPGPRAGW